MKKLAWMCAAIPAAVFAVFAMGANCSGSNAQQCTSNADCTTADSPLCKDGTCGPAECTTDTECLVDDAGGSGTCNADSYCQQGDRCLQGSNGNNHCVTEHLSTDPDCSTQNNEQQFTGTDVDGSSVDFCDNAGAKCTDGACTGVSG